MTLKRGLPIAYDAIVVGGGAAGLLCAITAGRRGKSVLVLEASNKLGKKILMSGGGRCNFTNLEIEADNFICNNPHFVKSALRQFTQWDFIAMVAEQGIAYHEKTLGQLFCDDNAKDILKMLTDECDANGVDILVDIEISNVSKVKQYLIKSNRGEFSSDNLIVASGGLSIPTLGGATGFGYKLAEQFGITVNQPYASLVPFTLTGKLHEISKTLSGVSIPIVVSVSGKGFSESMLFTHRGLSGPAILQISNYWNLGDTLEIDLLPSLDLKIEFFNEKRTNPKSTISAFLSKHLPRALISELYLHWWCRDSDAERTLHNYRDSELQNLADQFHVWQITPSGTEGYRTAEVTKGGVDVFAISSKTMQVKELEGLYFIGEVLDVVGHLGGYNFQWAWSSGYAAGTHVN